MNEQVHTHMHTLGTKRIVACNSSMRHSRQTVTHMYRFKEKQSTCDLFLIIDFHYTSILPSIGNFFYNGIPFLFAIKRNKAIADDRQRRISLYIVFIVHACDQERIIFRTLVD